MQRSPFRSPTSLALAALAAGVLAGCGDDTCGISGAPSSGLLASSAEVTIEYENLTHLEGNDCPGVDPPDGVISVSIEGKQVGGTGLITLCIPRPDLLTAGTARTLGTSMSMADIRIFDLSGDANNCTFRFDATRVPTGQGAALGACYEGNDLSDFALDFDGAVSLRRTCGANIDTVAVTLVGRIAVTLRD